MTRNALIEALARMDRDELIRELADLEQQRIDLCIRAVNGECVVMTSAQNHVSSYWPLMVEFVADWLENWNHSTALDSEHAGDILAAEWRDEMRVS